MIGYIVSFHTRGGHGHQRLLPRGAQDQPQAPGPDVWVDGWYVSIRARRRTQPSPDRAGADIIIPAHRQPGGDASRPRSAAFTPSAKPPTCSKFAPNARLTAIVLNWGPSTSSGAGRGMHTRGQPPRNLVGAEGGHGRDRARGARRCPRRGRSRPTRMESAIIAGELHPFAGPIRDQAGEGVERRQAPERRGGDPAQ